MALSQDNNILEALSMEEAKSILDRVRKVKQNTKLKYIKLSSHLSENESKIIYTITEARMNNFYVGSKKPVKIFEMTYIVDKTSKEIFHHETCVQKHVNKYS